MSHSDTHRQTEIQVIETTEAFSELEQPWNELAGDNVFHRWEWMYSWWEAYQGTGTLCIIIVKNGAGEWLAVAPWYRTSSAGRGRVVQMLASGHACSDYTSLLVREGFTKQAMKAIGKLMLAQSSDTPFSNVDLFELEGHLVDDSAIHFLSHYLDKNAVYVETQAFAATWRSRLPESWDDFQASISKSFRRKTKKAVQRLGAPDIRTEVLDSPEAISRHWATFVELHQKRRQVMGQPGCFASEMFEQFLRNAVTRLAKQGLAKINMVCHQTQPVSVGLELVSGPDTLMYQTGVDPARSDLEPGHLINTMAIQNAINGQQQYYDFLRGDEPYKARWNTTQVPLYRTRIVPGRLTARFRHRVWSAGAQLKSWTKSLLKPSSE